MILHPFKSFLFACKCRIYVKNCVTYNLITLQKKMFIFGSTCIYISSHISFGVSYMLSKSTPNILRNEKW